MSQPLDLPGDAIEIDDLGLTVDEIDDLADIFELLAAVMLPVTAEQQKERAAIHHHKCPRRECGHIWSHSRADIRTEAENEAAHTCPACGQGQEFIKCHPNGERVLL